MSYIYILSIKTTYFPDYEFRIYQTMAHRACTILKAAAAWRFCGSAFLPSGQQTRCRLFQIIKIIYSF